MRLIDGKFSMLAQKILLSYPGVGFEARNINTETFPVTAIQLKLKFQANWT